LGNVSSVSDLPEEREGSERRRKKRRRKLVKVGGARKFMTVILYGTSSRVPYGPTTII